jgi:hypothetical protein
MLNKLYASQRRSNHIAAYVMVPRAGKGKSTSQRCWFLPFPLETETKYAAKRIMEQQAVQSKCVVAKSSILVYISAMAEPLFAQQSVIPSYIMIPQHH